MRICLAEESFHEIIVFLGYNFALVGFGGFEFEVSFWMVAQSFGEGIARIDKSFNFQRFIRIYMSSVVPESYW